MNKVSNSIMKQKNTLKKKEEIKNNNIKKVNDR